MALNFRIPERWCPPGGSPSHAIGVYNFFVPKSVNVEIFSISCSSELVWVVSSTLNSQEDRFSPIARGSTEISTADGDNVGNGVDDLRTGKRTMNTSAITMTIPTMILLRMVECYYFSCDVDNPADVESKTNPEKLHLVLTDEGKDARRGNEWRDVDKIVRTTGDHRNG